MSEEMNLPAENEEPNEEMSKVIPIKGMYENWFLDYASYVILERAVPMLYDGFKPVQRRIMHSLKDLDDGRYHKVANIIGHTMKYHPHGDASIGDALVNLGQKELLIDMQGNWGNIFTGDRAAAPRYIEARLSKFALEVVYNPKVTKWMTSYDGRAQEPEHLPVKFPMLLTQGVEGIAVGLSTKILPHNFNELIDASIAILRGRSMRINPDFLTGGIADFSQYNDGKKGGRVKVRARISHEDNKTLRITELPFGTTTTSLIESVIKANDKGKIKIKKIEDNTAAEVDILIYLPTGVSPDKMIDALYAFTDCEISIATQACIILDERPHFLGVSEILKQSTAHTLELLKSELEIKLAEFLEQLHYASLEQIFIENRIYRDIEECESWEEVMAAIHKGLKPFVKNLVREVTDDDVTRLTEIRIKRISKYDSFKADEQIKRLEENIEDIRNKLANLVDYAIDYFKNIKSKYGKGRERKTEIRTFGNIEAARVVIRNEKLYVNREEGFVGKSMKKDEYVCECSGIDDIIVFRNDGKMMVTRVADKTYVGKDIIHVAIFKKNDTRTVYNMMYRDGLKGATYMKRFNVKSITRDKEYDLTTGVKGSGLIYFTANPNGEAEVVSILLKTQPKVRKLKFDIDFAELAIKGRGVRGNLVSKFPVKKVELKEKGVSTLQARKIWFDDSIRRLNDEGRGELLGEFAADDKILEISQSGYYRLLDYGLSTHFEDDMIHIEKFNPKKPVTAVYYDGAKKKHYIKRFIPETSSKKVIFISEEDSSHLEIASTDYRPMIDLVFVKERGKDQRENEQVNVEEFISVKGLKAIGKQLSSHKIRQVDVLDSLPYEEEVVAPEEDDDEAQIEMEF